MLERKVKYTWGAARAQPLNQMAVRTELMVNLIVAIAVDLESSVCAT